MSCGRVAGPERSWPAPEVGGARSLPRWPARATERPPQGRQPRRGPEVNLRPRHRLARPLRRGSLTAWLGDQPHRERESRREALANQLEGLRAAPHPAELVPPPALLAKQVDQLAAVLAVDPERGRALLERHVGRITLTPKEDGPRPVYRASGRLCLGPELPKDQQVAGAGFEPATFGL